MKVTVLLKKNVIKLGHIGDFVRVAAGYARNFLFPMGLAVPADARNKRELEHQKRIADVQKQKALDAAQELGKKISALSLTIQKAVGEEDRIFGTVTHQELADALEQAGCVVDRHAISIEEDIKRLGVYKGTAKLHPTVTATFQIWVTAKV